MGALRGNNIGVSCRGVTKYFGSAANRIRVLSEVDFDIPAGKITCLVGPSGCGKTTLASIIAGILSLDQGEVNVFGTEVQRLSNGELSRYRSLNIGCILQQLHLLPSLDASDNVIIPLLLQGVAPKDAKKRALAMLKKLGLDGYAERFPGELSTGQQQRIAIARAIIHEPRLVICDEPTAALDAASGSTAMELLRRVAVRSDRAVLVITHDPRILGCAK